uniref:Uncharacterized protein n=1 Tax=Sphaerodactylus townsendi TaxID=933632 RepID=A0ACB8F0U5_9SAUR
MKAPIKQWHYNTSKNYATVDPSVARQVLIIRGSIASCGGPIRKLSKAVRLVIKCTLLPLLMNSQSTKKQSDRSQSFLLSGARPKEQPAKEDQDAVIQSLWEQLREMHLRVLQAELVLETERGSHGSHSLTPVPADRYGRESVETVPQQMHSSLEVDRDQESGLQQLEFSVVRGYLGLQ